MIKKLLILGLILLPTISFGATYGSNFLTGGTATEDSVYSGLTGSNAFDGNLVTFWSSANTSYPHWIKYQISTPKSAGKLSLYYSNAPHEWNIKHFNLQGSNDNTNWTELSSSTNPNNYNTWNDFIINSTTTYTYFRLLINSGYGSTGNYVQTNEITLAECTDCHETSSTSTTSSSTIVRIMSPELDQLLIYILEGLVIVAVAWGAYKFYKS